MRAVDEQITREQAHHTLARHIRNRAVIRFTPPDHDAGPTHFKDGDAWVLRLSPGEADMAARAGISALEELGLIPTQSPTHGQLVQQTQTLLLQAGYAEEGDDVDFGWRRHVPIASGAHLLLTCEPNEFWKAMPGQAVRSSVSQHLDRYAITLAEGGMGVVAWGRGDQHEILIVAADQDAADRQAPDVIDYLLVRNPPLKARDEAQGEVKFL